MFLVYSLFLLYPILPLQRTIWQNAGLPHTVYCQEWQLLHGNIGVLRPLSGGHFHLRAVLGHDYHRWDNFLASAPGESGMTIFSYRFIALFPSFSSVLTALDTTPPLIITLYRCVQSAPSQDPFCFVGLPCGAMGSNLP